MRLFFWDFDDINDIEREWSMFVVNILALIFTVDCLRKSYKHYGKVVFEIIPLSLNSLATFLLLLIKLFEKGYEFGLVGYIIEIFTYFLFCYTFSLLFFKIRQHQSRNKKKVCNALLSILATVSLVAIILILTSVIGRDCDNDLIEISTACFVTEFISYIPTFYFGWKILVYMKVQEKQTTQEVRSDREDQFFQPISDQYVRQRQKQIKIVITAYSISLLLRGVALAFSIDWDSYFDCTEYNDVYILTSDLIWGQFLLVLIEINQLIPHLIIPVALFIIPAGKLSNKDKITLEKTLIDEEEQQDQSDTVQRTISSSILNRSKENSSVTSEQIDN